MPVPAIISAIVSSIINNAVEMITAPAPPSVVTITLPGRALPQDTTRGDMVVLGPMSVEISGQSMVLAPGAQIRSPANMIVMPSSILDPVPVLYVTDPTGAVSRVWILSAQEAAQ
jgi:hypothetical protein